MQVAYANPRFRRQVAVYNRAGNAGYALGGAVASRAVNAVGNYVMNLRNRGYRAQPANQSQAPVKKLVKGTASTVMASGSSYAVKSKKKSNYRSKGKPLSKNLVQKIKSISKIQKNLIENNEQTTFGRIVSAINKVAWDETFIQNQVKWENSGYSQTLLGSGAGTTTMGRLDANDVNTSNVQTAKQMDCSVIDVGEILFKNNTNAEAKMSIYHVRCIDDTSYSPTVDIDRGITHTMMSLSGVSTIAPPLTKEDNLQQYWDCTGLKPKDRHWKVKSVSHVKLAPGAEYKYKYKLKTFHAYPHPYGSTYMVGNEGIVVRQVGSLSHDTANTALIGISNTQVDYMIRNRLLRYQYQDPNIASILRTSSNSNQGGIANAVQVSDENVGQFDST